MKLREQARAVARAGRKGDKTLLHITPKELLALQASGRVTINPKTGLPEAWGFGGFFNPVQQVQQVADFGRDVVSNVSDTVSGIGSAVGQAFTGLGEGAQSFGSFAGGLGSALWGTAETTAQHLEDVGQAYKKDPERALLGINTPAEGALWGSILGKSYDPTITMTGGPTGTDYSRAQSKGYDTSFAEGIHTVAPAIALAAMASGGFSGGTVSGESGATSLTGDAGAGSSMPAAVPDPYATAGGGSAAIPGASAMPAATPDPLATSGGGSAGIGLTGEGLEPGAPVASLDPSGVTAATPFGTGDTGIFTNPFTGASNFNFGPAGLMGAYNMGTGLYGLYEQNRLRKQQPTVYDPFASQRAQYQQQLAQLASDPSQITKDPAYAAGLQAIQRTMAAQGYLGSGNMMTELLNYGGNFYNQSVNRLAGLAGANLSPVSVPNYKMAANDMLSRSLASMGFGLAQMAA